MKSYQFILKVVLSSVAILFVVFRASNPGLVLDGISALMVVVAMLPWAQSIVNSLEIPGGIKIEFRQIEELTLKAGMSGFLTENASDNQDAKYYFLSIKNKDATLALAGLRIELERSLTDIAQRYGYTGSARGIGNLLRHLYSKKLLKSEEVELIERLIGILNSAVHGIKIESSAADAALKLGIQILNELEIKIKQ